MIWVAISTGQIGVVFMQISMQFGWVLPLRGDIRMANHTSVAHTYLVPESYMTTTALVA
jgi:hypothetical protein